MTDPTPPTSTRRESGRLLVAVAALVLLALLVLNVAAMLVQDHRIVGNSTATSATVTDCTSPTGQCYRRMLRTNVFIVQCAKTTNTDDELDACVASRLNAAGLPVPAVIAQGVKPDPGPTPSTAQDGDGTP
jgi:hypothetical protein